MKDKLSQYFAAAKTQKPILGHQKVQQMIEEKEHFAYSKGFGHKFLAPYPMKLIAMGIAGLIFSSLSIFAFYQVVVSNNYNEIPNYKKGETVSSEEFQQLIEESYGDLFEEKGEELITIGMSFNSKGGLKKFGINNHQDWVEFRANIKGLGYLYFSLDKKTKESEIYHSKNYNALLKDTLLDFYPLFITDKQGRELVKHNFGLESHNLLSPSARNRIINKLILFNIPDSTNTHGRDRVTFWIYPTKGFKAIDRISESLDYLNPYPIIIGAKDDSKSDSISHIPKEEIDALLVSPNPVKNHLSIQLTLNKEQSIGMKLRPVLQEEHTVLSTKKEIKAGKTNHQFNLEGIEPGIYSLIFEHHGNDRAVQRLIIR